MSKHYILDKDHKVIEASPLAWAVYLVGVKEDERSVGYDIIGNTVVSTVFLGIGKRTIFETMVWTNNKKSRFYRYSTWDEALKGHGEVVEKLKENL